MTLEAWGDGTGRRVFVKVSHRDESLWLPAPTIFHLCTKTLLPQPPLPQAHPSEPGRDLQSICPLRVSDPAPWCEVAVAGSHWAEGLPPHPTPCPQDILSSLGTSVFVRLPACGGRAGFLPAPVSAPLQAAVILVGSCPVWKRKPPCTLGLPLGL